MGFTKKQTLDAISFTEMLWKLYFETCNFSAIMEYMEEPVFLSECLSENPTWNSAQALEAYQETIRQYQGVVCFSQKEVGTIPCSPDVWLLYGNVQVVVKNVSLPPQNIAFTILLQQLENDWKVLHLHLSLPLHPKKALTARKQELEILSHFFPDGAHQCMHDEYFTLLAISEEFSSMFGFSLEEIQGRFHGRFLEMIHPEDRKRVLSSTREQLQKTSVIELEYRVLRKDGSYAWILDKGRLAENKEGSSCFYCFLIEITDRKKEQEELRLSLERHQVIMDQATDIIFEWDIVLDTLTFSPNWKKKFHYEPLTIDITSHMPHSRNIHPHDIPAFLTIMREMRIGVPYSETEFRIQNAEGVFHWCRIRVTCQFDALGNPIKAVGVILDIDSEKQQKQELMDLAQRDSLTGLYNNAAMHTLVAGRIQNLVTHTLQALLILDIDHFKAVNDTYGHLVGDSLLSDFAETLRTHVRDSDLVGRIGGDEFAVYLDHLPNQGAALKKATQLLSALQQLMPQKGADTITCSIGISLAPRDATEYETLYKYADLALYHRKENGRKGATLFHPSMMGSSSTPETIHTAIGVDVTSQKYRIANEQLSHYVFRTLYLAENIEETLIRLLEIIGRSYDVCRTYIIETSPDGESYSNTFEWCATGIEPQKHNLQNLSRTNAVGDYRKYFNAEGVFYCADVQECPDALRKVLTSQGIHTMLQYVILDCGEFKGCVGFDECRENRIWSAQQISTFQLTADILSSYLLLLRQKQAIQKLEEALEDTKH